MLSEQALEWIPLLVPDMPSPKALLPWLERMHSAKHYSNFGPLVQELEAAFASQFGVSNEQLTSVANATLGIELVLQAMNLRPGAHVLVPAFTFVATATAVVRAGYCPVFADVDAHTWMLTPEIAKAACEKIHIDVVLPVATFGMPHDMKAWQLFEKESGVPVVIDAAAAYGSQWLQGVEGTLIFSMHTTKSLPAGEGGLVVSTRPEIAEKVRRLSNFGINLNASAVVPVGALSSVGTNAKMSEYHAAIGLASLHKWEEHAKKRRSFQADLMQKINEVCGERITWQRQGNGGGLMAPSLLCIRLQSAFERADLENACAQAHIMTRRWYQPLVHEMVALQPYSHVLDTPQASALGVTLLGLPFFLDMTSMQIRRVLEVFRKL